MKQKIKNRFTGEIIFESNESESIKQTIILAIKKGANLTEADLTRADLTRADLTRADLTRADLTRADLTGADLTRADLNRADLTGAILCNALFEKTKISYRKKIVEVNFTKME